MTRRPLTRLGRLPGVLLLCGLLAACVTTQSLNDLDSEWTTLYRARLSNETAAFRAVTNAGSSGQLMDLAERAAQAGNRARDDADAAAFYRVGIVAAWKAEDAGLALVEDLADRGEAVCASLEYKGRDCALFLIVPGFARTDSVARSFLGARLPPGAAPADRQAEVEAWTLRSIEAVRDIAAAMTIVVGYNVGTDFITWARENGRRSYCSAWVLMSVAFFNDDAQFLAFDRDMKQRLAAAGVSTSCGSPVVTTTL